MLANTHFAIYYLSEKLSVLSVFHQVMCITQSMLILTLERQLDVIWGKGEGKLLMLSNTQIQ